MPIRALAYASQAVPGLSIERIDALTREAERFNRESDVTGVLLFDGSRFLQYIEGPEDALWKVYSRILDATSHCEMMELGQGQISGRRFPYWSMRLVPAGEADLRFVSRGDWTGFSRSRGDDTRTGTDRLVRIVAPQLKLGA